MTLSPQWASQPHTTPGDQLQLTEKRNQDRRAPVHYGEDVGLIPLRFQKGFEAIPPTQQHPRAPHPNPHPQLRSFTSEGIQHQSHLLPSAVLGAKLQMLAEAHLAVLVTSREKPASRLLVLRGEDTFCSQAHSLCGGPQESQGSPCCP